MTKRTLVDQTHWLGRVLLDPTASDRAKLCAFWLAEHANKSSGETYPGHESLAKLMSTNVREIERCVTSLYGAGWITRMEKGAGPGKNKGYVINWDHAVALTEAQSKMEMANRLMPDSQRRTVLSDVETLTSDNLSTNVGQFEHQRRTVILDISNNINAVREQPSYEPAYEPASMGDEENKDTFPEGKKAEEGEKDALQGERLRDRDKLIRQVKSFHINTENATSLVDGALKHLTPDRLREVIADAKAQNADRDRLQAMVGSAVTSVTTVEPDRNAVLKTVGWKIERGIYTCGTAITAEMKQAAVDAGYCSAEAAAAYA